jgi:hypothetical protein
MQEPVGDDDGEQTGLGEKHGQVPAGSFGRRWDLIFVFQRNDVLKWACHDYGPIRCPLKPRPCSDVKTFFFGENIISDVPCHVERGFRILIKK